MNNKQLNTRAITYARRTHIDSQRQANVVRAYEAGYKLAQKEYWLEKVVAHNNRLSLEEQIQVQMLAVNAARIIIAKLRAKLNEVTK